MSPLLAMTVVLALGVAGEGGAVAEPDRGPDEVAPSREMLLYLAEFAAADGSYVDPASLPPDTELDPPATIAQPPSPKPKPPHAQAPADSHPH